MKKNDGRFKKGEHRSPATEFKPGEHWRERKLIWDRDWLYREYVEKKRSASSIAEQMGITDNAVYFWIRKHNIPTRSMSEIRSIKKWGLSGSANGMYGRNGKSNPHWRGGFTPDRQAFYSSLEWKKALSIVWKRDKGICKRCGGSQEKIHIHHVVPFEVVSLRSDPSNLVSLCEPCHKFVHSRKNITGEFIAKKGG